MDNPTNNDKDYYYDEKGLIVFSKEFHLKRGYCCKSGCKNCPYDYHKKDEITK
ncbi:MAG: DUF5522 domain-containing protein [Candidatus Kapabacteria bacterium]|nr:DUF5522 domain-containing protein [Candidatus Kapabacteria bacterium]